MEPLWSGAQQVGGLNGALQLPLPEVISGFSLGSASTGETTKTENSP